MADGSWLMAHGSWLIMNGRCQQCPPSTIAISHEPSAMTDLCNLRLAVRREPLAADAIFLRERLALGRIARGAYPRLMQHFVLGDLRLVEVADFGDGRLLFVGDGARLDAGVRIVLAKTLHRELERGFERFVVSHGLNGTPKRGALRKLWTTPLNWGALHHKFTAADPRGAADGDGQV